MKTRHVIECCVVLLAIGVAQLHAAMLLDPGHTDNCKADAFWFWDFTGGAETGATWDGTNWSIVPKTTPGGLGDKLLDIDVKHLVPCDILDAAQGDFWNIAVDLFDPVTGGRAAGAAVVRHIAATASGNQHADIYYYRVGLPAAPGPNRQGSIYVRARHTGDEKKLYLWSYHPPRDGNGNVIQPVTLRVDASYSATIFKKVVDDLVVSGGGGRAADPGDWLPDSDQGNSPTDVEYRLTFNPTTKTTLSFIVGEPGSFEEAPLGILTELLVGTDEFLVPSLFDATHAEDPLYVAVDLLQWLSFPTPYANGDTFVITGGTNPDLPGFLFSSTPIDFDPAVGFTTDSPWDGTVEASGEFDGHATPEPGTALLAGTAALILVCQRKRTVARCRHVNDRPVDQPNLI